jgi:hypothetical protein
MVNSEEIICTTEYLTLYTRRRINRCRYNGVQCICVGVDLACYGSSISSSSSSSCFSYFPVNGRLCLFSKMCRPVLGHTNPPM